MQTSEPLQYFSSPLPDLLLSEGLASIEASSDFVSEISSMRQLHNQVQLSFIFIKDGFPILDDVRVVD